MGALGNRAAVATLDHVLAIRMTVLDYPESKVA